MIKIEDLTKAELVTLVKSTFSNIKEGDLIMIRWETMCEKAKKLREESMAVGKVGCTRNDFSKSTKLWNRAGVVQKKADDFLAEWRKRRG